MLKKNDVIKLNIEDLTNLGFGVGHHEGQAVFVSDAVMGDVVMARIIKVNKSYAIARCESIVTPSDKRCEGRCTVKACKSCAYKNISYGEELKLKYNTVKGAFMHEGLADVSVKPTVPSPSELGYRNKGQYPIALTPNRDYAVGFYAPRSHRVTEARCCPLLPTEFEDIINTLTDFFKENKISVYDEESGKGLLRHIYLRRAEVTGEMLLTLVINGTRIPNEEALSDTVTARHKNVVGILINVNKKNTNVVLGDEYRTLFGRDYVIDVLADVRLKISAPAFYQVNRAAADKLYRIAGELAAPTKDDLLLDLFCGTGSIGLSMANRCRELVGIEIIDAAVECAKTNAEMNGITHAKFYTGDASDTEKLLANAEAQLGKKLLPDIIILDPPRSGCDERLIDFISTLSPKRVVYISCNPTTLARDCKRFASHGFSIGEVTAVDLFPLTGHVETIVCLCKQ